jgi:hypothetical protein
MLGTAPIPDRTATHAKLALHRNYVTGLPWPGGSPLQPLHWDPARCRNEVRITRVFVEKWSQEIYELLLVVGEHYQPGAVTSDHRCIRELDDDAVLAKHLQPRTIRHPSTHQVHPRLPTATLAHNGRNKPCGCRLQSQGISSQSMSNGVLQFEFSQAIPDSLVAQVVVPNYLRAPSAPKI